MNEKQISDKIFKELQHLGAIKWHKNANHSFYIKFKDVRLGSIRIANHIGREKYHYTYEISVKTTNNIEAKIQDIVEKIKFKAQYLTGFDPIQYLVWDKETSKYITVATFEDYKLKIYGK